MLLSEDSAIGLSVRLITSVSDFQSFLTQHRTASAKRASASRPSAMLTEVLQLSATYISARGFVSAVPLKPSVSLDRRIMGSPQSAALNPYLSRTNQHHPPSELPPSGLPLLRGALYTSIKKVGPPNHGPKDVWSGNCSNGNDTRD